jgi:hypothetical protein
VSGKKRAPTFYYCNYYSWSVPDFIKLAPGKRITAAPGITSTEPRENNGVLRMPGRKPNLFYRHGGVYDIFAAAGQQPNFKKKYPRQSAPNSAINIQY